MRRCSTCGCEIPQARLLALPSTSTCVSCSTEAPVEGLVVWDGKHTPILEVHEAGKRPKDRKGFHADIGANSPNNARMVASMANLNLSDQIKLKPPEPYTPVVHTPARCHPTRPKAVPDGRCLECALQYYRERSKR